MMQRLCVLRKLRVQIACSFAMQSTCQRMHSKAIILRAGAHSCRGCSRSHSRWRFLQQCTTAQRRVSVHCIRHMLCAVSVGGRRCATKLPVPLALTQPFVHNLSPNTAVVTRGLLLLRVSDTPSMRRTSCPQCTCRCCARLGSTARPRLAPAGRRAGGLWPATLGCTAGTRCAATSADILCAMLSCCRLHASHLGICTAYRHSQGASTDMVRQAKLQQLLCTAALQGGCDRGQGQWRRRRRAMPQNGCVLMHLPAVCTDFSRTVSCGSKSAEHTDTL
jgi:hypothetical protein